MAYDPANLSNKRAMLDGALAEQANRDMANLVWRDDDGTFRGPDHVALRAVPLATRPPGRQDAISEAREARDDATRRAIAHEAEAYGRALLARHGIKALLAAFLFAAPAAHAQGLYINAFAGAALFDTTETVGGIKMVDLGGDALTGGGRIGYGRRFGSGLYLGAEAEAALASGRSRVLVPAANSTTGQAALWSRTLNGWGGGFVRVGIAPGPASEAAPPSLFFLRAGGQAFATSMGTEWAPAIGAGAEIRLTSRLAARIDVTYAWSDIETYQGTIGLSWRF